jgi:hypothetical protein
MQVAVRSNTVIYNRALKDFHHIVPYALGRAKVDFIYTAEAPNLILLHLNTNGSDKECRRKKYKRTK